MFVLFNPSAMKNVSTLLVILFLCIGSLRSQTIVVTFGGLLSSAPIQLDSILVMNLTQGGDTVIYYPDNSLLLGTTDMVDYEGVNRELLALPNPFASSTEVHISSVGQGSLYLMVHDASGREVASLHIKSSSSVQRFLLTASTPGVYVLNVIQGNHHRAYRLVATEGSGQDTELTHLGASVGAHKGKSGRSTFAWQAGDELRYIGFAHEGSVLYSGAIQEVPMVSISHTFNLFAGIVCPDSPSVSDIDGNAYNTILIGTQCWMSENLRTASYANGDNVFNVTDGNQWSTLVTGGWAHYGNNSINELPYGKLYNWFAVNDSRNICPLGWHVPTEVEWTSLIDYLDGEDVAGGKLKAAGTEYWMAPNSGATNETGFNGLPGSFRFVDGGFLIPLGSHGMWWSASEADEFYAYCSGLRNDNMNIGRFVDSKNGGFSVRCVKD